MSPPTVTGEFVTNGGAGDLIGPGPIDFAVTGLQSILLNGKVPDLAVALDLDAANGDLLRWDRGTGAVTSLPSGSIDWSTGTSDFYLSLYTWEFGPLLVDRSDLDPSVSLGGAAEIVSLPEPGVAVGGPSVLGVLALLARSRKRVPET